MDARDADRRTPLMHAARRGDVQEISSLLQDGADVHAKDRGGLTALMHAAEKGHTEAIPVGRLWPTHIFRRKLHDSGDNYLDMRRFCGY